MSRFTSPIDCLPIEILSYIFELSTHAATKPTHNNAHDKSFTFHTGRITTPRVLSAVNQRWRQIALKQPFLWTTLFVGVIDVRPMAETDAYGITTYRRLDLTRVQTFIARSKGSPVDVYIDARDAKWLGGEAEQSHTFRGRYMLEIFSLILPVIQRWRSLNILTDKVAPMRAAVEQLSGSSGLSSGAPLLESLNLMQNHDIVSFITPSSPLTFGVDTASSSSITIPKMRSLCLLGVEVDWTSLAHVLPTPSSNNPDAGVHDLTISSHTPEACPSSKQFRLLLKACINLRTLIVDHSGPQYEVDSPNTVLPAPLPFLEHLYLGFQEPLDGLEVLRSFDAPNLRLLTLEEHPNLYTSDRPMGQVGNMQYLLEYITTGISGAEKFPERNQALFPLLESLVLNRILTTNTTSILRSLFLAVPALKHLEFIGVADLVHAIHALYGPHSAAQLTQLDYNTDMNYSSTLGRDPETPPCVGLQSLVIRGGLELRSLYDLPDVMHVLSGLIARVFRVRQDGISSSLRVQSVAIDIFPRETDYNTSGESPDAIVHAFPGGIEIRVSPDDAYDCYGEKNSEMVIEEGELEEDSGALACDAYIHEEKKTNMGLVPNCQVGIGDAVNAESCCFAVLARQ